MHLSSLFVHPLKSARGQLVDSAVVESEGLSQDRRFVAHTSDGTFVSGRSHPRLVNVEASWDGEVLQLSAPGMNDLEVQPRQEQSQSVAVWKDRFPAWDQGDAPARWLSAFLGDNLRLAWLGQSQRRLRWDHDRRVTFADAAPLLALGSASVDDLSRRVCEGLSIRRFRPNLVLSGTEPYEEDGWRRIRVGSVEFLVLDGCSRCEFTTIDPDTAERHPRGEPVTTLESYRKNDAGLYFGMNLMPLSGGTVHVGDPVDVLETRQKLPFYAFTDILPAPAEFLDDGEAELVCTGVRDEAPGVKSFAFAREDGRECSWKAGQYVTLRLDLPEGALRRTYSISSAPGNDLEITVKRFPNGRGSGWLHEHCQVGVQVVSEAIGGRFTLEDHPWNSLLLLGAGTGITPLLALVRSIADQDLDIDVAIHYSVHAPEDQLFAPVWKDLQARLGSRMTFAVRVTSDEGHLDHQGLLRFCPDLRDRRAFVCGPNDYRSTVRGLLAGAGLRVDHRYHEELFGEAALEVPDHAEAGVITFSASGKSLDHDGRTTVLQLAERAAIDLPSSCRAGDCGTCRVEREDGSWVLACHTFPLGNQTYKR